MLQGFDFLETLVNLIATISIAFLLEKAAQGKKPSFLETVQFSLSRWGAVTSTYLLQILVLLGLTLLLIIPGLVFGVYYTFAVYITALRKVKHQAALDYSKKLVKGRWWQVCGFILLTFLLGIIAWYPIASVAKLVTEVRLLSVFLPHVILDIVGIFITAMYVLLFLHLDRDVVESTNKYDMHDEQNMKSA